MKKVLIAVTAFVFAMSMFGAAFAAEKVKQSGTIKSMDAGKGTIVFCPSDSKEEITIKADPKEIKEYKTGDKVKVVYEKGATNTLSMIGKARTPKMPVGC